MASSILVTATQRGSGKSTLALGLVHLLESTLSRVGYFKPIGQRGMDGTDPDVRLMKDALGLEFSLEEMVPVTMDQVQEALSNGTYDHLLDTILEAYEKIASKCDFVVCEGTDYFGAMSANSTSTRISRKTLDPLFFSWPTVTIAWVLPMIVSAVRAIR